jgi:hypothetical protein
MCHDSIPLLSGFAFCFSFRFGGLGLGNLLLGC